ncbi:MAG TPA: cob(I)yrinic acid a,c-diamide adenosyltransferase [Dongiaceae bacterium]|jgi:cob(I)alamin adenosyltransferase|nr:cob(I)yrinic acid a,c-diamide adenosyltransferase [Dongiaceae bacterium]
MVRLTKIYTRTGDDGTTALGDTTRVAKDHPRIDVVGELDEANAALSLARTLQAPVSPLLPLLVRIQNDLFDCGADLCRPGEDGLRMTARQTEWLEERIDEINATLAPLTSFIFPGAGTGGASLHLARAVVRRAERRAISMAKNEPLNHHALTYLNRLSDLLFVMARAADAVGEELLWVPGKYRF